MINRHGLRMSALGVAGVALAVGVSTLASAAPRARGSTAGPTGEVKQPG